MPTQSSELERWLFLLLCLRSCQSQSKAEAPNPTAKRCRVKLALEVSGWSRRCQQGRSCLGAAPLVWPRASFVQTQLGSPAGEGSLDNITVTTRRTCLGYFQNARGGKKCSRSNKEACVQTASGTPFRWTRGNMGFARNGHMRRNGSKVHTSRARWLMKTRVTGGACFVTLIKLLLLFRAAFVVVFGRSVPAWPSHSIVFLRSR